MSKIRKLFLVGAFFGLALGSSAAFAQEDENFDQAQFARGAKAWAEQCGRCHNIRAPEELSDADWFVSTTHMRVRGNIPGDVIRDIQAFLAATNKKKK